MKISDALVLALREIKIKYLFGVSGANIEHVHDAVHRLGNGELTSIFSKSEQGAAFMADCHARVHRTLAVCCATSGGGSLNLVSGIAESFSESVPVLAIVGQPPIGLEGKGAFQDSSGKSHSINLVKLFESITKCTHKVSSADMFWPALRDCVTSALSGRMGPTALLIPRDIYDLEIAMLSGEEIRSWLDVAHPAPSPADLSAFESALKKAKQPVLIVGQGVRRSKEGHWVTQFALDCQIPTVTTMGAKGEFPNHLPNYFGMIGAAGHPSAHTFVVEQADLIIAAGTGLSFMSRGPLTNALENKDLFAINLEADQLRATFAQAHIAQCDVGTFMHEACAQNLPKFELPAYTLTGIKPTRITYPSVNFREDSEHPPLLQSEAIKQLEPYFPRQGHLVFDAGNCAAASIHYTQTPFGASSTIALGMGGMGYAVGGAIGAQLGSASHQRTLAIIGDGAFMMEGLEMHTAIELGLPILFVIFNNSMHGMCVTRQHLLFEDRTECTLYSEIAIAKLASHLASNKEFWVGYADTPDTLARVLSQYESRMHLPGIIEVRLRAEEMPPFAPFFKDRMDLIPLGKRS